MRVWAIAYGMPMIKTKSKTISDHKNGNSNWLMIVNIGIGQTAGCMWGKCLESTKGKVIVALDIWIFLYVTHHLAIANEGIQMLFIAMDLSILWHLANGTQATGSAMLVTFAWKSNHRHDKTLPHIFTFLLHWHGDPCCEFNRSLVRSLRMRVFVTRWRW